MRILTFQHTEPTKDLLKESIEILKEGMNVPGISNLLTSEIGHYHPENYYYATIYIAKTKGITWDQVLVLARNSLNRMAIKHSFFTI